MSGLDLITDPKKLSNLRERQSLISDYEFEKLKQTEYLKRQIIKHGRIDLLMMHVLDYDKVQDFHLLMYYHNQNKYKKKDKQKWHLCLAPRNGGKSITLNITKTILLILQNPNIKILITSKTDENAKAFLSEIKQKLTSEKVNYLFGNMKGKIWNEGEIVVAGRTSTDKEKTVETVGYTGALASKHFDVIIADDLVDEENSKTEAQRNKLWTWFHKILDPTLNPDGEMNVIGTRYHFDDLYGRLIDSVFQKVDKRGKVLRKNYIRIPALIKKKNFPANAKIHQKFVSFWPEKFSVKFLLQKKQDQGSIIFNCLTDETPVLTQQGEKNASQVNVGDKVWTGSWQKILHKKSGQHSDIVYDIKLFTNCSTISLTPGHQCKINGSFINADKVRPGDIAEFPINNKSDISAVPEYFRYPEFFRLVGHWLACDVVTNSRFSTKEFADFIKLFSRCSDEKYLPYWVQDLPQEYLKELFIGYYYGNGFYLNNRGDLEINSASFQILEGFQRILLKLGYVSKLEKIIDESRKLYGLFLSNRDAIDFDERIPDFKRQPYKQKGFIKNNKLFVKVRSVKERSYTGMTHDFEVETDHIFTSGLMTLHNSQMMNDVDGMKGKIFKIDWFNWFHPRQINMKSLRIFQGVDLAIKQREDADKFAHCTIGVDPKTMNIYILDYYNRVTHYADQKKVIKDKFERYDPIRVAIEANGYQMAILQDMKSDKELSNIRAVPIFTETDKTVRAWKLSAFFERGQVFLLDGMHEMMEHLLGMPDGRYKDLFDALDFAIHAAFYLNKKTRDNEPRLM